jgi:phage gp46-like protein
MECHRNEIQTTLKNIWGDELLDDKEIKMKNWTYLVRQKSLAQISEEEEEYEEEAAAAAACVRS